MGNRSKVVSERCPAYTSGTPSSDFSRSSMTNCPPNANTSSCCDCIQTENYISKGTGRIVNTSQTIYKYWQQTPLYARVAATAAVGPFLILPALVFALCLPFLLSVVSIIYCILVSPTGFATDIQDTYTIYAPYIKRTFKVRFIYLGLMICRTLQKNT